RGQAAGAEPQGPRPGLGRLLRQRGAGHFPGPRGEVAAGATGHSTHGGAMWTVTEVTAEPGPAQREALVRLLQDSVEGGASVGFLPPLARAEANEYWSGVLADVARRRRVLFAATVGDELVGSVQLELAEKPNGLHRAELQKLMVLRPWRGRGIGSAL